MKANYVPTLITPEVIERLNHEERYVLLDAVDQKPNAIVGKDWLERRPNAYYILLAYTLPTKVLAIDEVKDVLIGIIESFGPDKRKFTDRQEDALNDVEELLKSILKSC